MGLALRRFAAPLVLAGGVLALGAEAAFGQRFREPALTPLGHFAAAVNHRQYRSCVPLGWYPEPLPHAGFMPGVNLNIAMKVGGFQALWVGLVRRHDARLPKVRAVTALLDELVRVGMLERREEVGATRYVLTSAGMAAFSEDNDLSGDNPELWPFLCYTRLHTDDVAFTSAFANDRNYDRVPSARVRIAWSETPPASWATPFVRAHAVTFGPRANPAGATVLHYADDRWSIAEIDADFPALVDAAAWSAPTRSPSDRRKG